MSLFLDRAGSSTASQVHYEPPAQQQEPPKDKSTGTHDTVVAHTVKAGENVHKLIKNNSVPMTVEEFYELNPKLDRKLDNGKIDKPRTDKDPDGLTKGQTVYLKGPPNDKTGDATQDKLDDARAADRDVSAYNQSLKGRKPNDLERQHLADLKSTSEQKWKDVGGAVDYELSLAPSVGDRKTQVKSYAGSDQHFQQIVDDSAKRVQSQTANERNTYVQAYEVKQAQARYDVLNNTPPQYRSNTDYQQASKDLDRERAELRTAVDREIDEHFKTLGPATNYMPDAYKSVTDQMTERFADPTLKNLIRAGAIGHEVDAAKSDPQAQVRILTDRLKGAAPETTQAILADPRVSGLLDKVVANTYQKDGAVAASKMLRDLTEVASPELAKRLITSAQPTIDQMAKDLVWADRTDLDKFKANVPPNHEALFDSGGKDPYKTITDNLSVALSHTLPPGATTDQIRAAMKEDYFMNVGRTFASTLNGPQRDKFGYANVQSIEQGHAPYLLLSSIAALREGKNDFAADELGSSLHQGLKNLGEAVDNANEDFKEARAQAVFQSANFGAFEAGATNKKTGSTDKYWTNYESGNKDLIKTQEDVDRLSAGLVDTTTAVGASDQVLKGLRSEERITKENNKLAASEKGLELVSLSERGKDHLYRLMDAGDAHAPVVAQLQPENLKREARTFVFRVGVSYTIRQMEAARIGNETGNFKQAQTAIENMKKHAGLLGYSKERQANFMKMLDGIGEMQAAGSDQVKLANGLTKFQSAVGDIHNGSTLNSTTGIGFGMRALGVMFVAPILQKQLATFLDKDTPLGVRAQTVLNTASTMHLSAFTAAGVPYAMGYKNAATTFIGTIKNWSEPIVVASAVVELALTYDYLKSGEHQDLTMAGLHGISAVSNGMMAWSYMKAGGHWLGARALSPVMLSGWGTALAVASSVGIYMYGRAKEMSKFENGETQKYLESLGFKPDIAKQLMNQDKDGHSVGPVLQAYAKANGWDLNKPEQVDEYITWINNLGKEKVESLVTAAQHVQPGEDGGLPLTNDKAKYLALPRDPAKTVQQLKDHGIDTKIFYNQATQRWEDPTTQMFYTNDGWNYYGKIDDQNPDQILRYDLETTELMYADNRFQYANPDSIAGLEAWTISNGLALPEK